MAISGEYPRSGEEGKARPETGASAGVTTVAAHPGSVPPLVSRAALLKKLRHERFLRAPSTPGGRVLVGNERDYDIGYRDGHNAACRNLEAWLEQGNVDFGLGELTANAPLTADEQAQILAAERIEHEREQERQARERARNRWAFEGDVELDAISEAYQRALQGEGG